MRINCNKSFIVVKVFLSHTERLGGHVVLESNVTKLDVCLSFIVFDNIEKFLNLLFDVKRNVEIVSQVSNQKSIVCEGKIGEELKLE